MSRQPFEYRFSIRLHDTDAAGVLFFAHLLRHAHDAYEAFMERAGFGLAGLIAGTGPHLPLVHAEADFLAPLRHGEQVHVRLGLARLGGSSFTLEYEFLGSEGNIRARARTVHVALAPEGGKSVPLPDALRRQLELLETADRS
jgi:1,4-dihydroxy-2-naphthoyl-CoA hydrolase